MTEAQKYCREKYTDLATVDNMEDMKILIDMADRRKVVDSEYSQFAWIGLYDDLDSWRWSLSDTRIYKDGETEFRRWSPKEPNNENGGEHCVEMYDNGLWNDVGCHKLTKAVCVDIRGPNVTFVPTEEKMNWTEAQSYCRRHHTDLASVRNMTENQKCLSSITELAPGEESFWIGLFRDSWKWSDGSNSSFRFWRQTPREPNNRHGNEVCVAANLNNTGEWEDWICHLKRAFICYSVSASKQVVKMRLLKKSSSLDLDDPAVMEDILKQLKRRLEDQGVSEGIRLSWRKQSDGKFFHKEEETKKKKKTRPEEDEL
ncbi:C-type mannose receptor 2-like isoform 2-T4 [Acanthopagrus schlegelii]